MRVRPRVPWTASVLTFTLLVWSVTALGGGLGLVGRPDGQAIGFPLSYLSGTPFPDFLIPGAVLLTQGVASAVLTALVWRDSHRPPTPHPGHWPFAVTVTAAQVLWIGAEVLLLKDNVSRLPSDQANFFYAFWWGFGLLALLNLALVLTPHMQRVLTAQSQATP